jgi:hypothetical protein
MSADEEHQGREVSVAVKFDETGFEAKARSRTVNAFERLAAGLLEWPASWVEGRIQRNRLAGAAREELAAADRAAAAELLRSHPAAGQRTLENFLIEQDRKQKNRDAVAFEAMEELKALPPPAESSDSAAAKSDHLDEDWLNLFGSHAEHASSDHMRKLWGRVLAGEIRRPGSFALSTLRIMAELDHQIASTFEAVMQDCIANSYVPTPGQMRGDRLDAISLLEHIGLVHGAAGVLTRNFEVDENGNAHISNRTYALRVHEILAPVADDVPLRRLADLIREDAKYGAIQLLTLGPLSDDNMRSIVAAEVIKAQE